MSCDDADKTTLCLGHKMGPITTLDYVGLDTTLAIAQVLERNWVPILNRRTCCANLSPQGSMVSKMAGVSTYGSKARRSASIPPCNVTGEDRTSGAGKGSLDPSILTITSANHASHALALRVWSKSLTNFTAAKLKPFRGPSPL